jgi:hypothetical protein
LMIAYLTPLVVWKDVPVKIAKVCHGNIQEHFQKSIIGLTTR